VVISPSECRRDIHALISKDKNLAVYAKHTGAVDLKCWVRKVF